MITGAKQEIFKSQKAVFISLKQTTAPQKPQLTQPLIAAKANVTPSPLVPRQRKETDNHDNDPNRDAC